VAATEVAYDCVVVDAALQHGDIERVLEQVSPATGCPPARAIIFDDAKLGTSTLGGVEGVRRVRALEQLIDLAVIHLHCASVDLPRPTREMLDALVYRDPSLHDGKILIVDDDVRNIYAITAVLEPHGLHVIYAENGQEALEVVRAYEDIDLVLMDIMMPGMDGYEATRRIRGMAGRERLPIVALTAKAMRADRTKCLEAGASDYITKPVEPELLVSTLRVWLSALHPPT
jgi:CheY-like chemotaxis protein